MYQAISPHDRIRRIDALFAVWKHVHNNTGTVSGSTVTSTSETNNSDVMRLFTEGSLMCVTGPLVHSDLLAKVL